MAGIVTPDIVLGAGDTRPITKRTLLNAPDPQGQPGAPIDLTGATIALWYQPRNHSIAKASRTATIVGDPTLGVVQVDWATTGGAIAPGNYDARFVVTFSGGATQSVPDGPRASVSGTDTIGDRDEWLWLHVADDFVTPAP